MADWAPVSAPGFSYGIVTNGRIISLLCPVQIAPLDERLG
ncbi:MAG: hypothetical protein K0S58_1947 [Nitrospira sp.]|jgi:hypothetical protein|nr:hypothetical protein [Nitrospira sp.]